MYKLTSFPFLNTEKLEANPYRNQGIKRLPKIRDFRKKRYDPKYFEEKGTKENTGG